MVLSKQKTTIPLAKGVDLKADPKLTDGNLGASNVYQPYAGEFRKRYGFTSLSRSSIDVTGASMTYPVAGIGSPAGNLLVAGHLATNNTPSKLPGVFSYDTTYDVGARKIGSYYPCRLEYYFSATDTAATGYHSHDVATLKDSSGNTYICFATSRVNSSGCVVHGAVVYRNDGVEASPFTSLATGTSSSQVTSIHVHTVDDSAGASNDYVFLAVFQDGASLYYSYWRADTRAWSSASDSGLAITTNLGGSEVCEFWDTCDDTITSAAGTCVLVVYRNSSTGHIEFVQMLNTGCTSPVTTSNDMSSCPYVAANIVYDGNAGAKKFAVVYTSTDTSLTWGTLSSTLSWSKYSSSLTVSATGFRGLVMGFEDQYVASSSSVALMWANYQTATVENNTVLVKGSFKSGALTALEYFPWTATVSRAWQNVEGATSTDCTQHIILSSVLSEYVSAGVYKTPTQPGYMLTTYSTDGSIGYCGMHLDTAFPHDHLVRSKVPVDNTALNFRYVCLQKTNESFRSSVYKYRSAVTLNSPYSARYPATPVAACRDAVGVYMAAGCVTGVSGSDTSDVGLHRYPQICSHAAGGAGSGSLLTGTYYFQCTYEYIDETGERRLSAPSTEHSQVCSSSDSLTITVSALGLGNQSSLTGGRVLLYAASTSTGAKTLQTATSSYGLHASSVITVDWSTYTSTGEEIYTSGGVLENYPPPSGSKMCISDGGRMFVAPFDEPRSVYYSKKKINGYAYEFAGETFRVEIQGSDPITGLASFGGCVFIFSETAIYSVFGDGPDDVGDGLFLAPRKIADIGAVENSILVVPEGIVFKQPKQGWCVLSGERVAKLPDSLASYNTESIQSCIYDQGNNLWHYLTTPNRYHLVFDPSTQSWTTWSAGAYQLVDLKNKVCTLGVTKIYLQSSSVYTDDGSNTGITIYTPWLKMDGLAGFGRLYEIRFIGQTYGATCTATITLYGNYSTGSALQSETFSLMAGSFDKRIHLKSQKITSIRIDIAETASSNAGFGLTAIELIYGVKPKKPYSKANSQ